MGKLTRVIVTGQKKVGKTTILETVALGGDAASRTDYIPTIEDTYSVYADTERGTREVVHLVDTAGLDSSTPDLSKFYLGWADAYILVFAVDDSDSFNRMDRVKKELDKQQGKDKKEVPVVVLANKTDLSNQRQVDSNFAQDWALREKVRLYEVCATDRKSLMEPFSYLVSKIFHAPKENKFTLTKRIKEKQPGAAIVMDI